MITSGFAGVTTRPNSRGPSASCASLRTFFDVTLVPDDEGQGQICAHKVVLSACSPFFSRVLRKNRHHPNPIIFIKGVRMAELEAIINFMYNGELSVPHADLSGFLEAAETLKVRGLTTFSDEREEISDSIPKPDTNPDFGRSAPKKRVRKKQEIKKIKLLKLTEPPQVKKEPVVKPVEFDHDYLDNEALDDIPIDMESLPIIQDELQSIDDNTPSVSNEDNANPSVDNVNPSVSDEPAVLEKKPVSPCKVVSNRKLKYNLLVEEGVKRPYEVFHNASVRKRPVWVCDGFNYCLQRQGIDRQGREVVHVRCRDKDKGAVKCLGRATLIVNTDEFYVKAQHTCHLQDIKWYNT